MLLDLKLQTNSGLKGFFKMRGIFRLLRIFILIRKLNAVRVRREIQQRIETKVDYDLRAPLEKVLEALNDIRDQIHPSEERIIDSLSYCINMIQSNRLYEMEIDEQQNDQKDKNKQSIDKEYL